MTGSYQSMQYQRLRKSNNDQTIKCYDNAIEMHPKNSDHGIGKVINCLSEINPIVQDKHLIHNL